MLTKVIRFKYTFKYINYKRALLAISIDFVKTLFKYIEIKLHLKYAAVLLFATLKKN